jgi:hypothetical protein
MRGYSIELATPDYGYERFTVKVKRRFNVPSDEIKPCFRSRPVYELSSIVVGRNVEEAQVQDFLISYLREKGLFERLVKFKPV